MKLFFKHLLRSVKNRPTQPLILLLTMIISVSVTVCVLTLKDAIKDERYQREEASLGSADIEITLSHGSDSRFMFAEDAREILGAEVAASGYYEAVLSVSSDRIYSVAAVDFETADDIFHLEFSDYFGVSENTLAQSAFVSLEFAEENGLSAGETFRAELFGRERIYRVAGISDKAFIKKFDIMLDISGVVKALASQSALVASLGEDFRPCNIILLDLPEGSDIGETIEKLSADERFSDKNIRDISVKGYAESNNEMITVLIDFAVILCCIMTVVVSYSCFSILASERSEENYSFHAAGAKKSFLALMQYIEGVMYWLVGTAAGLVFSVALLLFMNGIVGFAYADVSLSFPIAFKAASYLLFSVLLSVSVFVFSGKREKRRSLNLKGAFLLAFSAVCAVLYLLIFLLPLEYRLWIGLVLAVSLLLLVFLCAEKLLLAVFGLINNKRNARLLKTGKPKAQALHYSLKNVAAVSALKSVAKMLSLLICAVLCINYTVNSLNGNVYIIKNLFASEYMVFNGTERCSEKLAECESVLSVDRLFLVEAEHEKGIRTNLISVSDTAAFNEELLCVTELPKENGAAISHTEAEALSLGVGDFFTLKQNNIEIELCVAEIVNSALPVVIFDCEYFGFDHSMLLPRLAEGFTYERQLLEISEATADQVASVASSESVGENILSQIVVYVRSGNFILTAVIIFSLIGIINTYLECYRSRKDEFSMYRAAGMSRSRIGRMKLCEISLTFVFALIFGIGGFLVIAPVINRAMMTTCYNVYENFITWLSIL